MKLILLFFCALLSVSVTGQGTLVPYRQLATNQFDLSEYPVVHIRLSSGNFDNSGSTIRITNVYGAAGATLWTNPVTMAWGKILAPIANDYTFVSTSNLYNRGVMVSSNSNLILSPGTNVIDTFKYSSWRIVGATTNPADSVVIFKRGIVQGQHLRIQGADVTFFTIPNGADLSDGTPGFNKQVLNGDLIGTTNTVIDFEFDGSNWTETGRYFTPDGGTVNNYFTNFFQYITVYSNSVFHGKTIFNDYITINTNVYVTNGGNIYINGTNVPTVNPTIGYLPYKDGDASFGDSPWFRISATSLGFNGTNLFLRNDAADNLSMGLNAGLDLAAGAFYNILIGTSAGLSNTTPSGDISIGYEAGKGTTTGNYSVALGFRAGKAGLLNNNVVVGSYAGSVTGGFGGATLIGDSAGYKNNVDETVAVGGSSLFNLTTGPRNVAVGYESLYTTTTNNDNTAIGYRAGKNTAATVTNSVSIGSVISATNSNEIVIGNANNTKAYLPAQVYANGVLLGASISDNWVASGTTNSTLPGIGYANGFVATNAVTVGGQFTANGPSAFNQAQTFAITSYTYTNTTAVNLDPSEPNYKTMTLGGNLTLTVSSAAAGRWFTFFLRGASTNCTLSLPWAADKTMNAALPTSLAANKTASLTVFYVDGVDTNAVVNYAVAP